MGGSDQSKSVTICTYMYMYNHGNVITTLPCICTLYVTVYYRSTIILCRLKEKFRVHSQPDKADALDRLTARLLGLHLNINYPRSAAHYGVIQFLLDVSDSPVSTNYTPHPDSPREAG